MKHRKIFKAKMRKVKPFCFSIPAGIKEFSVGIVQRGNFTYQTIKIGNKTIKRKLKEREFGFH